MIQDFVICAYEISKLVEEFDHFVNKSGEKGRMSTHEPGSR